MRLARWLVNGLVRILGHVLFRVDRRPLEEIPARGPLIIVSNHIGSFEVPLILAHLPPRRAIGLAKVETWDSPLMGWLFDLWEAIPLRRGEADLQAMRRCLKVLSDGDILLVAPEGTRSRDGKLLRGQPGVVTLALRSGAPILPVAHWGIEEFPQNLKHLRRTVFHFKVGRPFFLTDHGRPVTGEIRQQMADAIMCQLVALMPKPYHGVYTDFETPRTEFLKFA